MHERKFTVDYILHETHAGITTLTLNRPDKHNAFDDQLLSHFITLLQRIDADKNTRVVVLKANGRHFCAGADLHWMQRMATYTRAQNEADALELAKLLQMLNTLTKPIIALVHGRIMGGGVGLVACCDIVIAAETSQFCFSEVKLGLIPATIAPYIIRSMGFSAARRYFISAESFNAEQALQQGLIHHITPENQLWAFGIALANTIKNNGPQAMAAAKQLVNQFSCVDSSVIDRTVKWLADSRSSEEGKEGVRAFLEKRAPHWNKEN